MGDQNPTINPRENGPLVVKNVDTFILPDGSTAEVKSVRALCRCGKSGNKPFCDGSHNDNGFDSTPADVKSRDRSYSYEADGIRIFYNKLLCSHAGECNRLAPAIFDPAQRPWVQFTKDDLEAVKEVVSTCPSGALSVEVQQEPRDCLANETVEIRAEMNGPLRVRNVGIDAEYWADGQSTRKYVLCRCGLSGNKPFCDGSHRDAGWKEDA